MHMSTLLGMTQMVTALAESTPMTQSSQIPTIPDRMPPVRGYIRTNFQLTGKGRLFRETNETDE